ncbi:MAG: Zn-dependent hydrolase [Aggregatilineales bacterium]
MYHINRDRFLATLDAQAEIGATPDGGLHRPALSETDMEVRAWFTDQIESSGLTYSIDGAGNQSAILYCDDPAAKTVLIGSHLDSVPNGGRFDGALGVLAGFEALRTIQDSGKSLPFHLEIINFTDEEGSLRGLLGSSALAGTLNVASLQNVRGGVEALQAGMDRAGLTMESIVSARRDPHSLLGYMEVHIEQGTRLEDAQIDIGVVTSIVGVRSYKLTFNGEAAHAGTKPMHLRRDALWGASAMVQKAREKIMVDLSPGVVNFGDLHIAPGAFNIVPAQVDLSLEFRHGDLAQLDGMQTVLLALAQECAAEFDLTLTVQAVDNLMPAPMSEAMIGLIERAADTCNLTHTRLMSFAGHDAQSLALIVPSVMFFVPSVNGISHNPLEFTDADDCTNAAEILLHAVLSLAGE